MGPRSLDHRRGWQLALAASIALHGAVLVSVSQDRRLPHLLLPWTSSKAIARNGYRLDDYRGSSNTAERTVCPLGEVISRQATDARRCVGVEQDGARVLPGHRSAGQARVVQIRAGGVC